MKTWIFPTILACLLVTVYSQATPVCTIEGIDLVFVLDVSGSIGEDRFQMIREFAGNTSMLLDIGMQRSLVGVILFGLTTNVHFPVTQHTDASTLLPALNPSLPYRSGSSTNTAAALQLLELQGQSGGDLQLRDGYVHIAMIVTDGQSSDRTATLNAASQLHASNIYMQVYAVGVGNADITELNAIASDPDSEFVFNTASFDSAAIQTILENVTQQLCSSANDTFNVGNDPHFFIPLYNGENLCFSVQGEPDFMFSLIKDKYVQLNAQFVLPAEDESHTIANVSTFLGNLGLVLTSPVTGKTTVIKVSAKDHTVQVGNSVTTVKDKPVYVMVTSNLDVTQQISESGVPMLYISSELGIGIKVRFYKKHLDMLLTKTGGLTEDVHGLIGQFLTNNMEFDNDYGLMRFNNRKPISVRKGLAWNYLHINEECWYGTATDNQGTGVIEGNYMDYVVQQLIP